MRDQCVTEIEQAIGRKLEAGEPMVIERALKDAMAQVARRDPEAWRQLSMTERLEAGAKEAEAQLLHAAEKKAQRVALQMQAAARAQTRLEALKAGGLKEYPALAKLLGDADRYIQGVRNEYFSGLMDTIAAVEPRWFGLMEDAESSAALVREIFAGADGHTGNPVVQKAARVWLDVIEDMRVRFNAAGGDVGRLDYGYLPQAHDQARVASAGRDAWIEATMPLIDRSRYVDEMGAQWGDDAVRELLSESWETISSGGLNKLEPGRPTGIGMLANKGTQHRAIHFKDADAFLEYQQAFGRGGVFSAMQGHVSGLARDIALTETFGPNPSHQFRVLQDMAKKSGESDLIGPYLVSSQNLWDALSGVTGLVANERMAQGFQAARNVEVFGKLGQAFVSSVTDVPTYMVATGYNRLPMVTALANLVRSFGKDSAEYANRAGLVAESVVSDMNRWAEGHIGQGWTAKLANVTMKASLLEAWTNATRRAFQTTMMGALGKMTRGAWAALKEGDRMRLEAAGITETDWRVWQLAEPDKRGSSLMLTRQSLRAIPEDRLAAAGLERADVDRAVGKLLGYIVDESQFASLAQDLNTRAAVTRSTKKGTVEGELLRSVALFKGFPMAMISRHWGRMADSWRAGDKAMAVGYGAALIGGLTLFGGIALQLKDLVAGKDPRPVDSAKFWGAAFAQGGGGGIFGDLLYQLSGGGQSQTGQSAAASALNSVLGPVAGSAVSFADVTLGNLGQAAQGKETHAGAEAVTFAKSHLPFVGLWWARGTLDRMVLHDLQEQLSPGYLSRMRERARKDWGQDYWWQPGEVEPDRAPNFDNIVRN